MAASSDSGECPGIAGDSLRRVRKVVDHERPDGFQVVLRGLFCDRLERHCMLLAEAGWFDLTATVEAGQNPPLVGRLKAGVVVYAYNHNVWLLSP
jgi:hypothetical protein